MRVTLHEPAGGIGSLSCDDLRDVLLIAGADVPATEIARWTEMEGLLAYDWAVREHLAASDNAVRRRERPSFTRQEAP
jgi:hypothetical protein